MENATALRFQEKRRFWEGHVHGWRSSGLTQAAYCREHGLRIKSFGYWKRKLTACAAPLTLVEVPVSAAIFPFPKPIRLNIGEKYRIEIERGFDSETLRRLIGVL